VILSSILQTLATENPKMNNLNNCLKYTTLTNKQQSKHKMKFKVENEMIQTENENKKKMDKKWVKTNREK